MYHHNILFEYAPKASKIRFMLEWCDANAPLYAMEIDDHTGVLRFSFYDALHALDFLNQWA